MPRGRRLAGGDPRRPCDGELHSQYSAALLQPIPQPVVVALDLRDSTPVNTSLGQAFTNGMRESGVRVSGTPTARISLSWQIVGQGGAVPPGAGLGRGGGINAGSNRSGGPGAGLQGGMSAALPDFPDARIFGSGQSAQAGLLMLRAVVKNAASNTVDWVATVQCTVRGTDSTLLATQLGQLLGAALGKRVSQGTM